MMSLKNSEQWNAKVFIAAQNTDSCLSTTPKEGFYLWFFEYMDWVHVVLHGVDDDQHISKLCWDDPSTVVSGMLRPNNVDLVITQVSKLEGGEREG